MSETVATELDAHKLAAARLWASDQFPYLASAIFAAQVHSAPEIGRMVMDRYWRLHADPSVVDEASVEQLGGEILHLTSHLLRDHASRADDAGLNGIEELHHWVDAADAEISDDYPALSRISETITPSELGLDPHRLAEEYFRRGDVREGASNDCGSGAHGESASWEPPPPSQTSGSGLDKHERSLLRRRVASDVEAAGADASAGLRAWAAAEMSPTVDWRRELAAVLRKAVAIASGAVDYSYARPSRRSAAVKDIVLASMRQPAVEIAVVIDTSASVSEDLLGSAVTEIDGILKSAGSRSVRFIACDDAVRVTARISSVEGIQTFGGGGTDMAVGIAAALDSRPRPQVVVVLTDGFTPWSFDAPRADVIAGILANDDGIEPPATPSWATRIVIEP